MITVEDYAVLYNGDSLDILSGLSENSVDPLLYGHYAGNNKSFPDFVLKEERIGNK